MSSLDPFTGHNEGVRERFWALWHRLGPCIPRTWSWADFDRYDAIMRAEHARSDGLAAIRRDLGALSDRFPQTATLGEALALAGIDVAEIDDRLRAIAPPDEIGLRWEVEELVRAERHGTLLRLPDERSN